MGKRPGRDKMKSRLNKVQAIRYSLINIYTNKKKLLLTLFLILKTRAG